MSKREKLLAAMRNNPHDVRLEDLVRLLDTFGLFFDRQAGSHQIFKHKTESVPFVNLQSTKDGKAKTYQVKQVLGIIEEHGLEAK